MEEFEKQLQATSSPHPPLAQPEPPAPRGRVMRLFVGALVLGLAGATLYLLADRNSRFYYLSQEGRRLVVYRGAWLPSGKRPYLPDDPHTARIYAPIELPEEAPAVGEQRFSERQDLDRALFDLLADLAEERIRSEDERRMREGFALVERAGLLPGITGAQAERLRSLRAELSFYEGRAHLERALVELRQAREKLEYATESSSARGENAARLLRTIAPATEALSRALQRSRGWDVPELRPLLQEAEKEKETGVTASDRAGAASAAPRAAPAAEGSVPAGGDGETAERGSAGGSGGGEQR